MKTKFKKLYLAHPFLSRHPIREWELKMERKFGIIFENPFYDIEGPGGRTDTVAKDNFKKRPKCENYSEKLVSNDLRLLGGCEAVLAIVNGILSYGTIMEIVYAKMMKKPVFIVCVGGYSEEHPWLVIHSDKVFKSLGEFEEFLDSK